jgi:protein-tyrosine phosphatase
VFNWFRKSSKAALPSLEVDMHSHLLPGIDDGVKDLEEAKTIISQFQDLGYRKLITTPHVFSDLYKNTPAIIRDHLQLVRDTLKINNINIDIEAAAEYYLDDSLFQHLKKGDELLTIGNKYLLFETNFITEPLILKEFIFQASSRGYKLILAHPERYLYLHENYEKIEDLLNRGVHFQLNITSLSGYYSKPAQKLAIKMIENKHVHFLGSDCHHMKHLELLKEMRGNRYFEKALNLPLLNNSLR